MKEIKILKEEKGTNTDLTKYTAEFPVDVMILQLVTVLSRPAPKLQGRTRTYLRASARIRKGRGGES